MFGNLIRDNIPTKVAEKGEVCSYAVLQSDETYRELLRDQLIDVVNGFLNKNSVEMLAEVQTVINAIAAEDKEMFDKEFERQMEEFGGYEKKFVFLRSDRAVAAENAAREAAEAEKTEMAENA